MQNTPKKQTALEVWWSVQSGQRQTQQDRIGWTNLMDVNGKGTLFVLSDGMGGMKNGEKYAAIAVDEMKKVFQAKKDTSQMNQTLEECFLQARKSALSFSQHPSSPDGGATVIAVLIQEQKCQFLSVGDSKLYLLRKQSLIPLNREQTMGVLLDLNVAFGYIPKEFAQSTIRDALDNNLCEADKENWDMPPRPFELVDGDMLLMMSDGISHTLSDQEIAFAAKKLDRKGVTKAIEEAVRKKHNPKQDNYSTIAVLVHVQNIR